MTKGILEIGYGEPCPFCKGDKVFISREDNDVFAHLIAEHKMELTRTLFPPISKKLLEVLQNDL